MSNFKKSVYLAGAMSYFYNKNTPQLAKEWRDYSKLFLEKHNINCFNPCDEPKVCSTFPKGGLMKQNYYYLKNCDIVLVNLDMIQDSPGTMWELSMAWAQKKLVVAFGDSHWLEREHLISLIDVKFENKDEALNYINNMFYV